MDKNEEESDEDQSPAVVCTLQDRQMVEFKNQIVVWRGTVSEFNNMPPVKEIE